MIMHYVNYVLCVFSQAFSHDASEVLPIFTTRTPKNYEEVRASAGYARDWSSSKFYGGAGAHRFLSTYNSRRPVKNRTK